MLSSSAPDVMAAAPAAVGEPCPPYDAARRAHVSRLALEAASLAPHERFTRARPVLFSHIAKTAGSTLQVRTRLTAAVHHSLLNTRVSAFRSHPVCARQRLMSRALMPHFAKDMHNRTAIIVSSYCRAFPKEGMAPQLDHHRAYMYPSPRGLPTCAVRDGEQATGPITMPTGSASNVAGCKRPLALSSSSATSDS